MGEIEIEADVARKLADTIAGELTELSKQVYNDAVFDGEGYLSALGKAVLNEKMNEIIEGVIDEDNKPST